MANCETVHLTEHTNSHILSLGGEKMNKSMELIKEERDTIIQRAELLKVLAHPMRLCIVRGLLRQGACNVSYMQDCLKIPQSTISQHLAKLRAAGVISGTRDGVEVHYTVVSDEAARVIRALFEE